MYVCVCACMCRCVRVCMCVQHNANVIAEFEKRAGMAKACKEQGRSSGLGYFELNPLGAFSVISLLLNAVLYVFSL